MCGIAGFVGQGSRDDIVRMNAAQAWRGPDGSGVWIDPVHGVHLGHVRLAIIDLEGGAQPMWTPDGEIGIVFNGEIYNHAELRERTQGRWRAIRHQSLGYRGASPRISAVG